MCVRVCVCVYVCVCVCACVCVCLVFIDVKKAYDSVPRDCLWQVLLRAGISENLVSIIRSFHSRMSAIVQCGDVVSDPISVRNGLRQGCTMAPVLFNIFMWAVVARWQEWIRDVPGVGFELRYHCEADLYHKSRRLDSFLRLTESQFADDSALFAMAREGAEQALVLFVDTAAEFGLTVNATNTKFLVVGDGVTAADRAPMSLGGIDIVCVDELQYLGSSIQHCGCPSDDVDARVAAASGACGALQKSVFAVRYLDIHIKRCVFNACVLSLLLYGSECWTLLQCDIRCLSSFHTRIRSVPGITWARAWAEHISNAELLALWGDTETIEEKLAHRRLEWLGYVARMEDSRMPRQVLFGAFLQRRPAHGPQKKWEDGVVRDLRSRDLLASWFDLARESRLAWRSTYSSVACNQHRMQPVECSICNRSFARPSDRARYKCSAERARPVPDQKGARHCHRCDRWFRSAGGMAVHRCSGSPSVSASSVTVSNLGQVDLVAVGLECCQAHCDLCGRCFKRRGYGRHCCSGACPRPTVQARQQFQHVCLCSRRFRHSQDLVRHQASCSLSLSNFPSGTA